MIYRSSTLGRRGLTAAVAGFLVVGAALAGTTPAQAAPATSYVRADCNTLSSTELEAKVPHARCFAVGWPDPKTGKVGARAMAAGPPTTALSPTDIQDAYKLPDAGAGLTVAIVDAFGYDNAESDLAAFRSYYGLPACTSADGCFTKLDQHGGTDYPDQDAGWSIETALDLDAVSAACPKCKIALIQADSNDAADLAESVGTAATLKPAAISNSYGVDGEFSGETALDAYYDQPGIAVTVSSGDTGNVQSYPSTSPVVTSVGGTVLAKDDSARGWAETAWDSAGSGCSVYEDKPAFQANTATGCDGRADADVSADAGTGLAVYNTLGQSGWGSWGGTSLASPLVAAMYALAGTPTPGTYPNTYPYANASKLSDVTSGSNGDCGNSQCNAGTGWDGPTGLGTPVGVSALTLGDSGAVSGTIKDASGTPISGVGVVAKRANGDEFSATTAADGSYTLHAPIDTYDLTATKFGYTIGTATGIVITKDTTVTQDFTITAKATKTISGKVTDGSGHGWPMRAKITVDGYPGGAVYSDPFTGKYSVNLPVGDDYKIHVASADLTGYVDQDLDVPLNSDTTEDVALKVDTTSCDAPGYAFKESGTLESFTGWTGNTPQDGWTITDDAGSGQTWRFDNPGGWDPPPGGDSDFADIDSDAYGEGGVQDSSLVSPIIDLTGKDDPEVGFDTTYIGFPDQYGYLDVSLDGGSTWNTAFSLNGGIVDHVDIPIPQAAGHDDVRVRFRYTGSWSRRWELDNLVIGSRWCAPTTGGLVAGTVTDANTGLPLAGATVQSDVTPAALGVTDATGYYWLFSPQVGKTAFTVIDGRYTAGHPSVAVAADSTTSASVALNAGRLTVDQTSISTETKLGNAKTAKVKFGNTGKVALHVHLGEASGTVTPALAGTGSPASVVKALTSINPSGTASSAPTAAQPAEAPWTTIADYALPLMDDAVAAHDGTVYVAGGYDGINKLATAGYYDTAAGGWRQLPDLPEELSAASAGFIDDTFYVAGGWNESGDPSVHTYALAPGASTWTKLADMPAGAAAAGTGIVAGKMYVVAGCAGGCLPVSTAVYVYDAGSNTWTTAPAYPAAEGFPSCGGVGASVICTGGTAGGTDTSAKTYSYTPGAGGWTAKADLPTDVWGAASAAANGRFEVIGGAIGGGASITNQGYEFDPSSNTWTALPNAGTATYRGGAACGIYKVGGSVGGFNPVATAESLPGYSDCGTDVAWMSESATDFDIAPGDTVTVKITTDTAAVSQPGTYTGLLTMATDSPYPSNDPVTVTMTATPPTSWGKIAGTVTSTTGTPLAGATLAVCTKFNVTTVDCGPTTFAIKTDATGHYQLWLDQSYSPLEVIVAKDGYVPILKIIKVTKGVTTTTDMTLASYSAYASLKVEKMLS